jgi:hypothetical protein
MITLRLEENIGNGMAGVFPKPVVLFANVSCGRRYILP